MSNKDSSIPQPEGRGVNRVFRSKGELMLANLLGGMAWGVGSVLGATIIVAILLYSLSALDGLPLIGGYITEIVDKISQGMRR